MLKKMPVFITLILLSFILKINAQVSNVNFRHYSTNEGLSQRSVIKIIQDDYGYLWFGTRYGLNRFDGHNFKNYYYNANNENSLSDSWITSLLKDSKGNLWVGTSNGFCKYVYENDNFIRIQEKGKYFKGQIFDLIEDEENNDIWISSDNGFWQFNKTNNSFKKVVSNNHFSKIVLSTIKLSQDSFLICTDSYIDLYNKKTNSLKHFKYPNGHSPIKIKNNNVTLYLDSNKKIWLGYNGGLAFFDPDKDEFVDYLNTNGDKVINSSVRSIHEGQNNDLWVGTYNGLYHLYLKSEKVTLHQHDVNDIQSISQNSVYDIYADTRGDLWIATWAGGINFLDTSDRMFSSFSEGTNKQNLNYRVVSSIVEDKNQNLWIGTEGGGLNFYDKNSNEFTYYKNSKGTTDCISDNNIKALLKDINGDLWIGTHNKGVDHITFDENGNINFENIELTINSSGLSSNRVTALVQDKKGNIWIGTDNGGINIYDISEKKIKKIEGQGILGTSIYTISNLDENTILVGNNKGLCKIDINTKILERLAYKQNYSTSYNVEKVISINVISSSEIWIGTEGDGLFLYDYKNSKTKRFGIEEGLPDEVVYGIVSDEKKNIWISTNKGISKLNVKVSHFKSYDISDGIQGKEFNYGAYYKSVTGDIVFGGVNGLTIFNPNKVNQDNFEPPLVIESLTIRNKGVLGFIDDSSDLTLKYNQNDIIIDYITLNFSRPNKNQYAYKLEGFDNDWNYVGTTRTARYTNLDPGNYRFVVKATNNDGVWSEKQEYVNFYIAKPLWKTWWAYLIYLILLSSGVLIIRKYSILRIRQKAELEQERINREEAEEVNKLKLQLFTNISHDFRTPLTLIIGPLKQLINEGIGNEALHKRLVGMYKNASVMLQLINQLLDFRKSEAGRLKLKPRQEKIIPFLNNIFSLFDELAEFKEIHYLFETDLENDLEVWFDEVEMKKVIINVLSNAFKFTSNRGQIVMKTFIKSYDSNKKLNIIISDTGKGIKTEDIPYIFDRYFQLGQKKEAQSGTGVGLALAKDIVELHNGEIFAKSDYGKGTSFTIELPLKVDYNETLDNVRNNVVYQEELYKKSINPIPVVKINDNYDKEIFQETINESLKTLLIVEDNYELRAFIKNIFKETYNVLESKNGFEGLEVAKAYPVDIIISDIMMPEMNGMEFCEKIKLNLNTSHIIVILLTARTSIKSQKEGYKNGADAYLTKPFDVDILKDQVHNLLVSRTKFIEKYRKEFILKPKELNLISPDEIFLNKLVEIIEENFLNSNFNAAFLVSKMNMSQSVVYRKIKLLTNQSISGFIRITKLKRAAQLLKETNMNVSNIVFEVGFNDLKYFRKCFRDYFNENPSDFRKKHHTI